MNTKALAASLLALLLTLSLAPAAMAADGDVVAEGSWTAKGYSISGSWQIVSQGDDLVLELDDSFKTRKAPDLKLFLSPLGLDKLKNDNATQGAVLIAELTSPKGGQSYTLPAGTDLGAFTTLVLHCEQYSKLWGGAALP